MTPGGRLSAAMEILDAVIAGEPAERVLTRWARASRFAGSKDRAAIRDIVYDVLRRRRSCLWSSGAGQESGRALVTGLLVQTAPQDLTLYDGAGHAPAPLGAEEEAGQRATLDEARVAVRCDFPDFLEPELRRSLDERLEQVMTALRDRAPVDLRVNRLRATPDQAAQALRAEGIETEPLADAPDALRVVAGQRGVAGSRAYRDGMVELQDAASQQVAAAVRAEKGMRVLDLCAGGGGKTLALAAHMGGQGTLAAYDANPARMRDLPARAERAGVRVTIADDGLLARMQGAFDRVLVDAPCSGTGAWRRNPDQKWRLTQADLAELVALQARILDRALTLVRPEGRILYATCSLLACENEDQPRAFLDRHDHALKGAERRLDPGPGGDGFYFCELLP
ncbi:RsmB/NOP family class I SAM-dependent RNA methyltransferase [Halovulum dunhuangense]|uniref:RsmB/NOP family class I SAM-dependent RNA methyltransferase n=1 Tax=Halovulum dunhuangense TaxID=1505036 RepID=A0A849L2S1_9RHOB|nr:RsmB/NOP family class I SAM-dependent RNA methyltransferase [Halovulum dunhuangense]NNU80585.1 RsmB/NOP family class I SAM-dependent RNA methyltransferase [Halovulum dunhuangense]